MSRTIGLLTLLSMTSLLACSSDSSTPKAAEDAGAAATDSAATPTAFRVLIFDADTNGSDVAKNVTVALTPPGGGDTMESATDDSGIATFEGLDWSKGDASLTVYGAKRIMWSVTGINTELIKGWAARSPGVKTEGKAAHDFFFFTASQDSARYNVPIEGLITGKTSNGAVALVTSTGGPGVWESPLTNYGFDVGAGVAFRLHAVEWAPPAAKTVSQRGFEGNVLRWVYKEQAAITAKTQIDLDFATATPLTPVKFKGKLVIPGGDSGALGGTSIARLETNPVGASAHLARYTKVDVSADKAAFEYEGEYVTPPGSEPVQTRHLIQRQDGGASLVFRDGPPVDGETIDGFMDPPAVTVSTQSLYEPWAIAGGESSHTIRLLVMRGREPAWFIDAVAGAKSVTPPKLPPNAEAVLANSTLNGGITVLADSHPTSPRFMKVSASRSFKVTK